MWFDMHIKYIVFFLVATPSLQDDSYSKVSNHIFADELKVLPTHAFKDYPSSMGWETYILIQATNLTSIETEALFNVRLHNIDIIHNELETLTTKMFVNVSVRAFYLNDNKIKSIQVGTFDDVHPYDTNGAFKLSLAGNRLKSISKGIFNQLEVSRLYLQNNLIDFIEKGSFNYMPKLELLHLSNNLLQTVDVGIFQNLGDDIYLSLEKNKITFVDPHAFENNTNLELHLKYNKVDMVKGYFTNSPDIVKFVV